MVMQMNPTVGLTGYTWRASVNQADIDTIKSYEKPIEEIHKYQPDTKYFKSEIGDWSIFSTTRHAEIFGPGSVKAVTE